MMGDCSFASSLKITSIFILLSFQIIELSHFSRGQGIHSYFSIVGVMNVLMNNFVVVEPLNYLTALVLSIFKTTTIICTK